MDDFKYDHNYPSVLYKYLPTDRFDFFDFFSLRVTQKSSLNDPFEQSSVNLEEFEKLSADEKKAFLSFSSNNRSHSKTLVSKILEKKKNSIPQENFGIISLSETPDNLLLWSLYASDHRGCCIEFSAAYFRGYEEGKKANANSLHRVIYRDSRFDARNSGMHNFFFRTNEKNTLTTKSSHWVHEHEWRVRIEFDNQDLNNLKKIDNFGNPIYTKTIPAKYITTIIFGASCSLENIFTIKNKILQNPDFRNIKFKMAVVDPIEFKLRLINITPEDISEFEGNVHAA